jgi:hypothetical protein
MAQMEQLIKHMVFICVYDSLCTLAGLSSHFSPYDTTLQRRHLLHKRSYLYAVLCDTRRNECMSHEAMSCRLEAFSELNSRKD